MPNPAISRDDVHRLAEACSDVGADFQRVATRLLAEQRRLTRFLKQNVGSLDGQSGEVALYLYAVIVRIFEQYGGRLRKVSGQHINRASDRVNGITGDLLPFDRGFPERVRAIAWRAQPHILDEALWALFERDEKEEGEVDVAYQQAALLFLLLWVATEALDVNWASPDA
jgi:hypothetical protein